MLDAVMAYMPSPYDVGAVEGFDVDGNPIGGLTDSITITYTGTEDPPEDHLTKVSGFRGDDGKTSPWIIFISPTRPKILASSNA